MSKEMNNLTVRIFALIMAIMLWSFVMGEEKPIKTVERTIPVQINNLSVLEEKNLLLIEPKDAKIDIEIKGKRNTLNKLTDKDILATVDFKDCEEGTMKLPVNIEVPPGITLVGSKPKEISFRFEKMISKEVVVELETTGELPKGYTLGDSKIVPQSLYVEGARSWIESIDRAVVNIDLNNRTDDISVNTPIQLLDAEGNIIRDVEKEKNTVDVFIPIHQTKQVPIEMNVINKPEDGEDLKLGLKPNFVEITGKKELLEKIKSIKTEPINAQEIYSGMTVSLVIPDNIHLVTKDEIKLIINPQTEENAEDGGKLESKTFRYSVADMNILGLKEGLKLDTATLSTTVELTIEGKKDTINVMDENDFDIQIDLTDLDEGEYDVTPMVPAKPGVTLARIVPENLKIKLVKEE